MNFKVFVPPSTYLLSSEREREREREREILARSDHYQVLNNAEFHIYSHRWIDANPYLRRKYWLN